MSTKIRLARFGGKKNPHYSIVVSDSRSPRDSNFIEKIGTYAPLSNSSDTVNKERAEYWLSIGAIPTERVALILLKQAIVGAEKYKPIFKPSETTGISKKQRKEKSAA